MSGDVSEFLERRKAEVGLPVDDTLDPPTVDRIEALHSAVLAAEAERRFSKFGGRRAQELEDARAAEQEFLDAQGFASYNDYRLRIRRSAAVVTPVVGDAPSSGDDAGAAGNREAPCDPGGPCGPVDGEVPAVPDAGPEQLVTSGVAQAVPAVAPLQTGPFMAELKRELDAYLTDQSKIADARAARIVEDASRRGADVVAHARRRLEEAELLMAQATGLAQQMSASTAGFLSAAEDSARRFEGVLMELRGDATRAAELARDCDDGSTDNYATGS